eukprot:TRINITY_DN4484_c0_g1_i2.p1 TRINITY_DN4484_c0_g1~~TRINITY_DN4484_c0_g1_i2.p1  ORF type:complete len:508 (-),score=184.88 TRINITY_DN4484_c0_g1_i2:839-2362(-)
MHEQVFLGMVASSVPPKKGMTSLIEDMMASGVRFVYFSPRNMRRSKAIAENMGIETDWNCAISLRPLDEPNTPDPHRMTSTYADWDVKARLPHGIAAIREHIRNVDNVPLLVSLFTDATAQTTMEMLKTLQEYGETVLCVGTSYRAANAGLFRAADLSLLQAGLPMSQPLTSLPRASATQLSAADIRFNSAIVGLCTALPLADVLNPGAELDDAQAVLIDLIREGRRLLLNAYQACAFALWAVCSLSLLLLLSSATPVSVPPTPNGVDVAWLLCVVLPLLAISLLSAPATPGLMRKTSPEKNADRNVTVFFKGRHAAYVLARALPTVVGAIIIYLYTFGVFVEAEDERWASECDGDGGPPAVVQIHWCKALEEQQSSEGVRRASGQAFDLCLAEFVLVCALQTLGFMHRTAPAMQERPWTVRAWQVCAALALLAQLAYTWVAAATRSSVGLLLQTPWEALVAGALWPFVVLAIGEVFIKRRDAALHGRYMTFLRLEFNTRLGMHSPR